MSTAPQDPHNLLLYFLSELDQFKAVYVIGVPKEEGELVVGHSRLAGHEVLGALSAALCIEEVKYQSEFIDNEPEKEK